MQSLESAPVSGDGNCWVDVPAAVVSVATAASGGGLYLRTITLAETMVYARKVPIDMNSTRCLRSKRSAMRALANPLMARLIVGTWVRLLTRARKPKRRPSLAIEYIVRGSEKREPNNVVVIPQRAPTLGIFWGWIVGLEFWMDWQTDG